MAVDLSTADMILLVEPLGQFDQHVTFLLKEFRDFSGNFNICTVKLGYKELGYNEHSVITNK